MADSFSIESTVELINKACQARWSTLADMQNDLLPTLSAPMDDYPDWENGISGYNANNAAFENLYSNHASLASGDPKGVIELMENGLDFAGTTSVNYSRTAHLAACDVGVLQ